MRGTNAKSTLAGMGCHVTTCETAIAPSNRKTCTCTSCI